MLKYHIKYKLVFKRIYYHPSLTLIFSSSNLQTTFIAALLFLTILSSPSQPPPHPIPASPYPLHLSKIL